MYDGPSDAKLVIWGSSGGGGLRFHRLSPSSLRRRGVRAEVHISEGGMIQMEILIEHKFINSSFSSLSSY